MEQEQIIPTGYKQKIPHTLSYPVGAKVISTGLFDVPQFSELSIEFRYWNQIARRHGTAKPYPIIEAEFRGRLRSFSASRTIEKQSDCLPRWIIGVHAVPRPLRHMIQIKILTGALPLIRSWLIANGHSMDREGWHQVTFNFDELKDGLTSEEDASLAWQTMKLER